MPFIEFSQRKAVYDVCVIGSGPSGLAVALACSEAGQSVVIVEIGDKEPKARQALGNFDAVSAPDQHFPVVEASANGLGGSGAWWGGLCTPLDRRDFEIHNWPIDYDEFSKWIDPSAEFLGCTPKFTRPHPKGWPQQPGLLLTDVLKRVITQLNPAERHSERLMAPEGPDILLTSALSHFEYEQDPKAGTIISGAVCVTNTDERGVISAQRFVLACGGLGTARILLNEERMHPEFFQNATPTGRSYLGHITGSVATIRFKSDTDKEQFSYQPDGPTSYGVRRLTLDDPNGRGPLNIAFWAVNFPENTTEHRAPLLSLKHLIRRLAGRTQDPAPLKDHLVNILRNPIMTLSAIAKLASVKMGKSERLPDILVPSATNIYKLKYHSEHLPTDHNKVILKEDPSCEPLPALDIKFEFDPENYVEILEAHKLLKKRVNATGMAEISLDGSDDDIMRHIKAQAKDGIHQLALTPMSSTPANGVVNTDCKHHDVSNLFCISVGILPSAGQANPTLNVVAFALRLAEHLNSLSDTITDDIS